VRPPPPLAYLRRELWRGSPKRLRREGGRREIVVHLPAAIAAAGAALLVVQWAAARPLWLDEEFLAINLRDRSISNYLEPLWLGQTAPFGWLVLERLVVGAFGTGERALRLLPMLFGIATLAAAARIGRRWMSPLGATLLVVLCAASHWLTFYFLELKPYSADVFFALLLPALAAWSVEVEREARMEREGSAERTFWIVAAIAQWFANGALFVTPLCAVVLAAILLQRDGWRSAIRFSIVGLVWLVSFALNYVFVLRYAQSSAFFQRVWAFAFPPPSADVAGTVQWFGTTLAAFGVKPGSTRFGILLWLAAFAGFAAGSMTRKTAAIFFATVPVSAILLAALHLVPFYERVTLWIVPALYVGVALLADVGWAALAGRSAARLAAPIALAMAIVIAGDIVIRGVRAAIVNAQGQQENRGHDDRAAVRWLASQKQPGDVWMTTHFGVLAIWWYAGLTGHRIVEVAHQPEGPPCQHDSWPGPLADAPRVLLYLGFRYDDVPAGFDDMLVDRLSRLGEVTAYRSFANEGHALIVDRRAGRGQPTTLAQLELRPAGSHPPAGGCLALRIAEIPTFVR